MIQVSDDHSYYFISVLAHLVTLVTFDVAGILVHSQRYLQVHGRSGEVCLGLFIVSES